ncbi:ATP-dependent RNA helicase RhlE [Dyadobacter sp. BE34]|uniref:ATP-dependent RNA helicase RhlE n=1 Tax=Dyadobacter fermentans TaxID=94254 RepID=A0ABU1QZH3_9BACT|nr:MULTISPECIES: DEAD/DEAH box helicase [Dyadobacter]MDR6806553.1 ATP-dependent RNA helicase RhlE [Dyadobacter fermentans]MDR7044294.1 ATP-dependent RNA helicase RhlE [Dyadobacter sp. BE242]MDR7198605.1 ATP-dependent RNA helicase RhlE [Dyadobacter sp. BE34]MDR7216567.1 ATP-dependent RNA helicase RhlE [Dyadobacter sp. BE31]MDR7263907.1 ATP-dependent RNA helicase RhlE [Dyadobacter sp. BE32]
MKFEDYPIAAEIKRSLEAAGFKKPTDIQFKAIPAVMKGEDVLAIAQTGTGKTAAFAIPVVDKLHKQKTSSRSEGIKCVVMVPTRELAIQIADVFVSISRHTKVKTFSVFGGVEQGPQIAKLEKGIDILVSTPGRMFDLVSQGHIKLDRVDTLILDEADHMLDLGFIKDIQDLIRHLPKRRQTLFFSATIDEKIKKLAYSLVRNAIRIQISPKNPVAKNIDHSVAFVAMDDKRFFLERVIRQNAEKKILVFVRTKVRAERVYNALERMEIKSLTIHGDKEQADRLTAMNEFKKGNVKVLIATDVSARGIDIPNVDYVINYDLPEQPENYVHRVGRTGRGMQKGIAVSFCSEEEKPVLDQIQQYLDKPIAVVKLTAEDYAETLEFTTDAPDDLGALMREVEEFESRKKKKGKK